VVKKINEELNCFSMQVSTQGMQMLFLTAQTYTNSLANSLELIYERQPLLKLEKRKQTEKESFIAKLTHNDRAKDESLAVQLSNEMSQYYQMNAKKDSVSEFTAKMKSVQENFFKSHIFNEIENQCIALANLRQDQHYQFTP